jgi:threonine aldolase
VYIDLISDTVTRPTVGMLKAMMSAEVGDDVFKEDPTVNRLEAVMAERFGKEAALFCPSGTMTNQIAVKLHTSDLDEVILDESSHVYLFELGGYAFHSRAAIHLLRGIDGKFTVEDLAAAIKPSADWLPQSKLVIIENSSNRGGGNYYTIPELKPIVDYARSKKLKLHLDGARLFNVLVETGESAQEYGELFDSVSICFSKGLGAPVGSCLLADAAWIAKARKMRKAMGGGMRQAGFLAAAALYALDHHVDRLREDNDRAKKIAATLSKLSYIQEVKPVKTNILIFSVKAPWTAEKFLAALAQHQIRATTIGAGAIRFVTHLDFTDEMCTRLLAVLESLES